MLANQEGMKPGRGEPGNIGARMDPAFADLDHIRGDFFGELSLLDQQPRSATVQAVTDMKLLVLGQAQFAGLLETIPTLASKLLKTMAHRLREADARAATG